ncbi:MAG: hypothetical protein H0U12_04270, partial [Thermoleophilaceae bacterium]|nr:hypothetical protein [Thermoleophilaceae bacterium]
MASAVLKRPAEGGPGAERDAKAGGPLRSSVRTQTLVPFGLGLVLIAMLVGAGTTLIARGAVERELETRANSAARLLDKTLARTREAAGVDAERLAEIGSGSRANAAGPARELEAGAVDFAIRRELAHVTVAGGGTRAVVNGRPEWRELGLARRLWRRAGPRRPPATGTG